MLLPKTRPPTHPGEMLLKEFLEPMGLHKWTLQRISGWTWPRLNEIVKGRRSVTADSALAFGEAFGTGPKFWLNLQRVWDLWHAMKKRKPTTALKKAS